MLQKLSILSIDVVIGSVFCGAFAVKLLDVQPGFAWWFILPVSVWIIYTTDHMIDGYRIKDSAHAIRHLFHFYHAKKLTVAIAILSTINLLLIVFFLDRPILKFGIVAVCITGIYLLGVLLTGHKRSWFFQKELFVALLYSIGIWGGPMALINYQLSTMQWICLLVFCLLALADLLLFSIIEHETDKMDGHHTIPVNMGIKESIIAGIIILTVVLMAAILMIVLTAQSVFIWTGMIYFNMAYLLLLLLFIRKHLIRRFLYRYLGELVFWLPGFLFLV